MTVSDLASTRDSINSARGEHEPEPLYSAAYDVFEMWSAPPCEPIKGNPVQHRREGRGPSTDRKTRRTSGFQQPPLLSAQFPIISPGGVLRVPNTRDCSAIGSSTVAILKTPV